MVQPLSRNAVDAYAGVNTQRCSNLTGDKCSNGQAAFWYSQGQFHLPFIPLPLPPRPPFVGVKGPLPSHLGRQIPLVVRPFTLPQRHGNARPWLGARTFCSFCSPRNIQIGPFLTLVKPAFGEGD